MHSQLIPAVVAGFIEGVVEWLPVSSKTIITLFFSLVGLKVQSAYALGLIANAGSFFAALVYFRREVWGALKSLRRPLGEDADARLMRFVIIGTIATGVVGIPIYIFVQQTFSIVGGSVAMIIIGALLLVTSFVAFRKERLTERANDVNAEEKPVTVKEAVVTGAMQGLAALPGISRSAVTMTPLLWMGYSAESALRLSFLLDVVALLGAGVVPIVIGHTGRAAITQLGIVPTIVMLVVAAVVSFFAIHAVLGLARKLRTSIVTLIIGIITIAVPLWAILGLH